MVANILVHMNANNYEYRSTFDEVISKIIRATFSVHSVFMSVSDNFTADPLLYAWSAIVRVDDYYWLLLLFGGVFYCKQRITSELYYSCSWTPTH